MEREKVWVEYFCSTTNIILENGLMINSMAKEIIFIKMEKDIMVNLKKALDKAKES